jgi:2-oxo-4-hydroxy-4-carboxy-5-ureidoimidazoline decarboxylase
VGWLADLNAASAADAERELHGCCASPAWTRAVAGGRPYPRGVDLLAAADAAFATLTWPDIAAALEAHPRIGDRVDGASAREQAGVADHDRAALLAANREYEQRFGHVFLICATGRTGDEMLAALRARLGNDPGVEQAVVRDELRKITRLRLERLAGS